MSELVLDIKNLHVSIDGSPILKGLDLQIKEGEVHAVMGRNGAGKSTLASVVMGHPAYEITEGEIFYRGTDINEMDVFERARAGMFLSFQYPAVIPGVKVGTFLKKSTEAVQGEDFNAREFRSSMKNNMTTLDIDRSYLNRYVNDGFSGGEKKRLEILQMMMLKPKMAILDETDSGLDIDAMKIVSAGVNSVIDGTGVLVITHYQRLLDYIKPDFVHVMIDGRIVKSGGAELALELEAKGYDWLDN